MKISTDKKNSYRILFVCILLLILFIVFFSIYVRVESGDKSEMNKGWTVIYHHKTYRKVDLYTFRLPDRIKADDQVVLQNTIPMNIGRNKALTFQTNLSTVSVYVNRRIAYVYMNNKNRVVKTPGNGLNTVILPDNARGRECQVIITAGVDNAFRILPLFSFVDAWNGSALHMNMYLGTAIVGFFMTFLGVILICLSLALLILARRNPGRGIATGLMSFTVGIWSMFCGDVMGLFSSDFTMNMQIGYLCIYFSLIPLAFVVAMIRGRSADRLKKIGLTIGIIIPVTFFVIASWLDLSGRAYVSQTYNAFLICAVVSIAIIMFSTGNKGTNRSRDVRVLSVAIDILFIGVVVDEIRYMLRDRIIIESRILYLSIMPYIALAFIFIMMYSYLVNLNDMYMEQAKNNLLRRMAYTDVLTGLRNRAYYMRAIDKITLQKRKDYTIISMDVNGLKKVNDTFGHAEGDRLIRDCATILSDAFEDKGDIIRMGGDEFVIIVNTVRPGQISRSLRKMSKLEDNISQKRKYDIHISYGIASYEKELDQTPEELYRIADGRMYDMKRALKNDVR